MGVCLQNYLYLSCYLSRTSKLSTKLKLRHGLFINLSAYSNYLFCIFIDIYKTLNKRVRSTQKPLAGKGFAPPPLKTTTATKHENTNTQCSRCNLNQEECLRFPYIYIYIYIYMSRAMGKCVFGVSLAILRFCDF